mgnify:FL=1
MEGKAPPEEPLDEPESLEDGLKELVDAVKEACVAAEAQDEGRRERAARR